MSSSSMCTRYLVSIYVAFHRVGERQWSQLIVSFCKIQSVVKVNKV